MILSNLSRRDFLKSSSMASGGLLIGITIPIEAKAFSVDISTATFTPNAFIHLQENGDTLIYCGRCEMGQGISTALPAIVADEMEADWDRVTVKQADGNRQKYGNQATGGSASIRTMFIPMREAGAAAKTVLLAAAAKVWQIDVNECYAESHFIMNKNNQKKLGYGELAGIAATLPLPKKPTLKNKQDFRYIGRSLPRHEKYAAVTGKVIYGVDAKIPGLKYAAIVHCPVLGGKLKRLDASAALAMAGVDKVVEIPRFNIPFGSIGGVAVVANNTWSAQQAIKKLIIEWDLGDNKTYNTETYKRQLIANVEKPAQLAVERGNLKQAFKNASHKVSATYTGGHLSHAPMEPNASLVWVKKDSCEVWASTQSPESIQKVLGQYLNRKPEDILVHVMISGGAFGRKFKCDYVHEAAVISEKINAPVQLTWSREEDMRTGYYHSISAQHIEASLDANGNITGWLQRVAFPSIKTLFDPSIERAPVDALKEINNYPFGVANFRTESGEAKAHTRIGWYRAVYAIFYGFANSTFADELAHKAGIDSLEFLNQALSNNTVPELDQHASRCKRVLNLAAEKAHWDKKLPQGQAIGLAVHYSFQSYVAMAVKVEVKGDSIRVLQVDCAIDCGQIINVDGATAQMEGAVVMGMSLALSTEIRFKDGAVVNSNFHDYPVMRISDMPDVAVHIVASDDEPTGLGEPGVAPFAPALSNAVFAASGVRHRDIPFKPMVS